MSSAAEALATSTVDLADGARRWRLWTVLAWEDLRQRYRRTSFGIIWAALSFGLFCGAKIAVFGLVSGLDLPFFAAWVVLGFLAWQFISGAVVDGCSVFISADNWIKGVRLPFSTFAYQSVARLAIVTAYAAGAAVLILLAIGQFRSPMALAALVAVPVFLVNAFLVHLLLGPVCARYRDVQQLVQTTMRIMFFLTPIIWVPSQLGPYAGLADLNPFTHYLAIFRAPVVDAAVPWTSWFVVLAITAALALAAFAVFGLARRRMVLWL